MSIADLCDTVNSIQACSSHHLEAWNLLLYQGIKALLRCPGTPHKEGHLQLLMILLSQNIWLIWTKTCGWLCDCKRPSMNTHKTGASLPLSPLYGNLRPLPHHLMQKQCNRGHSIRHPRIRGMVIKANEGKMKDLMAKSSHHSRMMMTAIVKYVSRIYTSFVKWNDVPDIYVFTRIQYSETFFLKKNFFFFFFFFFFRHHSFSV